MIYIAIKRSETRKGNPNILSFATHLPVGSSCSVRTRRPRPGTWKCLQIFQDFHVQTLRYRRYIGGL